MLSSLKFPYEIWDTLLPKELMIFAGKLSNKKSYKYNFIPESYKPQIVITIRNNFWKAVKEGRDTTDFSSFASEGEQFEFLELASSDPYTVPEILSMPSSHTEELSIHYQKLLVSANEILDLPLYQDGELDHKLLAVKQRYFSNLKAHTESLSKIQSDLLTQNFSSKLPLIDSSSPVSNSSEGYDGSEIVFFEPKTVEDIRSQDKRENLKSAEDLENEYTHPEQDSQQDSQQDEESINVR